MSSAGVSKLFYVISTLSRGSVSFLLYLQPTAYINLFMICD